MPLGGGRGALASVDTAKCETVHDRTDILQVACEYGAGKPELNKPNFRF
jgi:hypothetical protein